LEFAHVSLGTWGFLATALMFYAAPFTFIASVCEWLSEEGDAKPILLHLGTGMAWLVTVMFASHHANRGMGPL
jgi:hypothetical protein